MTLRVDLDRDEVAALRELLADRGADGRTLELVRDGRVLQRVEGLRGPLRDPAAGAAAGPAVRVDVDEALDPPSWLHPALPAERAVAPLQRLGPLWRWLCADGVFAVAIRRHQAPPVVVWARLRDGRVERLAGGSALDAPERGPAGTALVSLLRRRLGRPRAVVEGSLAALRAVAWSRRPATAFEYARMRGEIQVSLLAPRISLGLLLLRLLGR